MISPLRCVAFLVSTGLAFAQSQPKIAKTEMRQTSPASAQEMYAHYCAACHGRDGKGNGPAAVALKKPPADLTLLAKNNGGKFPENRVYHSISGDAQIAAHGTRDMPVWGQLFREISAGRDPQVKLRLSNLTNYLRGMQAR